MTLAPHELQTVDSAAVTTAGVSDQGLIDAIHVCALFNMIVRLADSLGWDVPPPEALAARAPVLLERGYAPSRPARAGLGRSDDLVSSAVARLMHGHDRR